MTWVLYILTQLFYFPIINRLAYFIWSVRKFSPGASTSLRTALCAQVIAAIHLAGVVLICLFVMTGDIRHHVKPDYS